MYYILFFILLNRPSSVGGGTILGSASNLVKVYIMLFFYEFFNFLPFLEDKVLILIIILILINLLTLILLALELLEKWLVREILEDIYLRISR